MSNKTERIRIWMVMVVWYILKAATAMGAESSLVMAIRASSVSWGSRDTRPLSFNSFNRLTSRRGGEQESRRGEGRRKGQTGQGELVG